MKNFFIIFGVLGVILTLAESFKEPSTDEGSAEIKAIKKKQQDFWESKESVSEDSLSEEIQYDKGLLFF